MKRPRIVKNEIYHVLNRGVDKRKIFLNDEDRYRFIHDLFEFNDIAPAHNLKHHLDKINIIEVGLPKIKREPRKLLVEILAFCMMENHFHLLVRPKSDGALTLFMRKLGTGYTNYFNQKYERSGSLYEGKFKIIHVSNDAHFNHLPFYIHCNPLDYIAPSWRNRELINHKKVFDELIKYRWSSLRDYLGIKNFPSITQRDFLIKFFDSQKNYEQKLKEWLRDMNQEDINEITLE